ncbi:MAG: sulfotransferase family 2 domain-containing protein [Candidatus Aminicenantes bacterium]|nr:sulfotransferase family 2 domain-containing protein [Candidatus Aminicenantes bacterium]
MKESIEQTIFFLHIPKCAGTTLTEEIIKKEYLPEELIIFYEHGTGELIRLLQEMPRREQEKIKCFAGHYAYGVHKYYTARPAAYLTLLRDPCERVVSHYYDVLRRENHYLHKAVAGKKEKSLTLKEYVENKLSIELDNGQTRILAGVGWGAGFGECSAAMLEQAKKNLETFAAVGISEEFEAYLDLINKKFGWEIPAYDRRNVAGNRPEKESLDRETLSVLEQYNALDIELYDYARRMFRRQLEAAPGV